MVVADLTHAYHATSGGIRTYIDAKRRYLLEHTPHTHVLIIPGPETTVEHGDRWKTFTIAAPVIPFAKPYRAFVQRPPLQRALRAAGADVVEVHSQYAEPWQVFKYRNEHPGTVASGYYHTDFSGAYIGGTATKAAGARAGRWAERRAETYVRALYNRCDLRLAPTPAEAARLTEIGVADVHVAPHGVDLDTFHPRHGDAATIRERYGVALDALLLCYAGRLDAEKRTRVMVDAVRRVNRTRPAVLLLAGQGPSRDELEADQTAGAPVRVLPFLDKADLATVLASSDVYLTAGPFETFGLSVVEAQASGLPVVGVAAGALVDRVPPAVGRLGPTGDAAAMAANVLAVADDRDAMSRAARQHAEASFSWEATFRRLFALYDEALARAADRAIVSR